jgi:hypothetical protein
MNEYDALLMEDQGPPQAENYDLLLEDQGPPSTGVSEEALNPRVRPSVAQSALIGAGDATEIIGAPAVTDAIGSVVDVVRGRPADRLSERPMSILEAWQANRRERAQASKAAQADHPLAYLAGNVPALIAGGMASAAAIPKAVMQAAPVASNAIANMGNSILQHANRGDLGLGSVLGDVALGEAAAAPVRIAQHGVRRTIGEAAQLPQQGIDWFGGTRIGRALSSNASDVATSNKVVKDLKVAQQSYLTDAGKKAAEADAMLTGNDLPTRLAASAARGPRTIQTQQPVLDDLGVPRVAEDRVAADMSFASSLDRGNWAIDPREFGDDFRQMSKDASNQAMERVYPQFANNPKFDLEDKFDAVSNTIRRPGKEIEFRERVLAGTPRGEDTAAAIADLAAKPQKADWHRGNIANLQKEVAAATAKQGELGSEYTRALGRDKDWTLDKARSTLEQWQAAKAAQKTAELGGEEVAKQLANVQAARRATGRSATENIMSVAGAISGAGLGHGPGGLLGTAFGAAAGDQLASRSAQRVFQGVDKLDSAGQKLAAAMPTLQKLSAGGGPLGKGADWVLSAKGPAMVARLTTLMNAPEYQEAFAETR